MTDKEMQTAEAQTEGREAAAAAGDHPSAYHDTLLDQFQESLEQDREKVYQRWGVSMFHSLDDAQAEAEREQMGVELQDSLDYYNRGCLKAQQENYTEAVKLLDQAIKLDEDFAEAYFNRALALEKAGKTGDARNAWNEFLQKFGDHDSAAEVKEHLTQLAE